MVGAVRPNSFADLATLVVALVGISLPSFVIGTVLLLVFGVWLRLLPVGGWGSPAQMVLPAVTLSLPFAAYIAPHPHGHDRAPRVRLCAHGAGPRASASWRSSSGTRCKNAFLPVLSYLGPATALAMTAQFVVERVFNVPGLGQHFINAVQNKDLFLIIGVVLVFSTMLVLLNLAVDVLYRWVDPRIE